MEENMRDETRKSFGGGKGQEFKFDDTVMS